LAAVSLLDDLRGLPVKARFLAHFFAAAGCLLALGLGGWALLAGTLAVVWMTNLFNFMDGSDGLAGGMAVVGFGALALAAWTGQCAWTGCVQRGDCGSCLGFSALQFPAGAGVHGRCGIDSTGIPGRDAGHSRAPRQNVWSWVFPVLVFSPFILDASVTLVRRASRGEKIWQAHRSHYYQRVVLLGASHRQLALAAYVLMLGMAAQAFTLLIVPIYTTWVLIMSVAIYMIIFLAIDVRWRRFISMARYRRTRPLVQWPFRQSCCSIRTYAD
jgi:UDP-GlcNAc:undecaprenyl-phosphate/decaprenyl-phosphate GlcNAc-1-phosphate transferase